MQNCQKVMILTSQWVLVLVRVKVIRMIRVNVVNVVSVVCLCGSFLQNFKAAEYRLNQRHDDEKQV